MKPNGNEKLRNGSNPFGKNPSSNFTPDKEVLRTHSNGNGSPLRVLREEKGLSQRALARKLGIEKTRIIRAERKPWGEISMTELEFFSQGLGIRIEDLILRFNGFGKDGVTRSGPKSPFFVLEYMEGVRLASHQQEFPFSFTGTLTLSPHKTLAQKDVPRGDFVYFYILQGELLVTVASRPHLLREGENLSFEGRLPYELYNPHQFKGLVTLLFTVPSFLQASA